MNSHNEKAIALYRSIRTLFKQIFSTQGHVYLKNLSKPDGYTTSYYFYHHFIFPLTENKILVNAEGSRYQVNPDIKYLLTQKTLENSHFIFDLKDGKYSIAWSEIKAIYDSTIQPINNRNEHSDVILLLKNVTLFEKYGERATIRSIHYLMEPSYALIKSLIKQQFITREESNDEEYIGITETGKNFLNQELFNESFSNQAVDSAAFLTAQQQTLQALTHQEKELYNFLQKKSDPFESTDDPFNITPKDN